MGEPALKKLKSSDSSLDENNSLRSILLKSGISYDKRKEGFKGLLIRNSSSHQLVAGDNVTCKKSITQALQFDKPLTNEVITDLEQELSDTNSLKIYLVPMVSPNSSDNLFQESVIRLLLNIDCIQPQLLNILLEKLPLFNEDEKYVDTYEID
jgi:hypothetical protein